MDPAEERRETKRQKEFINMQGYVADSEYEIPTRCPCGGRIIDEVRGKDGYDTLPGKRFFTCKNYEADGFHYRQPWVIGVQEHIERLTKCVEEVELVIKWVSEVNNKIERLETEVKALNREVDNLTGQVYNLSVQVADLEKSSQTIDLGCSEVPKPASKRKWTTKEDVVLISAWLNTSKDPIVSNEQKAAKFWKRIEEYVNASPLLIGSVPREWSQSLKEQASSQNENDVMKAAHDIFFNDYHVKFSLEHCWRELRFDQKWRSHSLSKDGAKEKMKEPAEEVPAEEDVRPPGVKASKAAKRKKHANEAAFDQIESILVVKNNISKQKILDRLLAKIEDTLSDQEVSLKNKLISEML
ncbi:hypothetical protein Bca101_076144 [Brassica carinata]